MIARVVRRFGRKHRLALALLAVLVGIVFLPSLVGRIVSPNDVYLHYDPWDSLSDGRAQNPLIHDPPLSYFTLASMLKRGGFFHWNPFIGGGIPGVGSVASAMLSPFTLLPALLLPLPLFYTGVVSGKLLFSFWFGYLWLREERLGKNAAAVGATVIAAAGPYVVWWLWQGTNATSLYPALLYVCARIANGKTNRFVLMVLLALFFLLSGFPATIAYGAYFAVAYLGWGMLRRRIFPWPEIRKALLAAVIALMIAAPLLAPFVDFLGRTGYLETRVNASSSVFYSWSHLRSFVQPYWLGDPVTRSWIGDSALGTSNNFVEATVYLGFITLLLIAAGFFVGKGRSRWFFGGAFLFLIGLMFGSGILAGPFAWLPGLKFSPMIRLRVLLPIPAAWLAAYGYVGLHRWALRRPSQSVFKRLPAFVAVALAADLALFAAWFTPHATWRESVPPTSDTITFLQSQDNLFRIAPTFPYLMPNSAQLVGVEDVRAHWGAEREWRDLLRRLDPGGVDVTTVSTLNSLRMDLDDPLISTLNIRYIIEPPKIDIIRYLISDRTEWIVPPAENLELGSGDLIEIDGVDANDCQAIAIPFEFRSVAGSAPWLEVSVHDLAGGVLWSMRYKGEEVARLPVIHAPMIPRPVSGMARVVIESNGVWAYLRSDEAGNPSFGCVESSIVLARAFADGRVFENLAVLPRFYASWEARSATREEFLTDLDSDPARVTTFEGRVPLEVLDLAEVPTGKRQVEFEIGPLASGSRKIVVDSEVPFLLSSSEKISPELRVTVDGDPVRVFEVNSMFAAVSIDSGTHEVVFERRIGKGWWPWSGAGLLLLLAGGVIDRRRSGAQP